MAKTDPTPKAAVLGSPPVAPVVPVDAPVVDEVPLDLDAAILAGESEFTEAQVRATAAATQDIPVIPEVTSPRDQAMLDAAAGRRVSAMSFEDPSRQPAVLGRDAVLGSTGWNGVPTRFRLAHPVMHNQRLLKEGDFVEFEVNPIMAIDPLTGLMAPTGRFIGTGGPTDQSEHVAYLYQMGIFADTQPADIRNARQAAVDNERGALEPTRIGADESGNPIVQPAMRSLAQPTGDLMEQRLREHRGIATPAVMLAAERMASSAGAEAPGSSGPRPQRTE